MKKQIIWKDINSLSEALNIPVEGLYYWKRNKNKFVQYEKRVKNNKEREFYKPQGDFKKLLKKIDVQLKKYRMPKYFYGSPKRRSAIECAKAHLNSPYIFKLDLKDFFPNTHYSKVNNILHLVSSDEEIIDLITNLCTYKYCIPQGFPTSPSLAEMTLLPLTDRLLPLCKQYGLKLSIYIDDICISGSKVLNSLQDTILMIIKQLGLKLNYKKKEYSSNRKGIVITGVLIKNNYPTTKEEFDNELDALIELFYDEKSNQSMDQDFVKLVNRIKGKINHVQQIDKAKAKNIISKFSGF